jgi:hypothetical protein
LAQIAIKAVAILQTAKVNIAPAVTINIAEGQAGTIEADLVLRSFLVREDVGEVYSSGAWRQKRETGFAFF